jgi:hypothetical protein
VTNLAADGALETASLLARDNNHKWPLPGDWFWSIEVGSPKDLRRLKKCYQKIILMRSRGHRLSWSPPARMVAIRGPRPAMACTNSSCNMMGHPAQRAQQMQNPGAMVIPVSSGGVVDDSLPGFTDELSTAFDTAHIPPHFGKLARADADERHLFVALHDSSGTSRPASN